MHLSALTSSKGFGAPSELFPTECRVLALNNSPITLCPTYFLHEMMVLEPVRLFAAGYGDHTEYRVGFKSVCKTKIQ
eukprot:scaffold62370_cov37-Prasinocladus_malaysianus.AAC.1